MKDNKEIIEILIEHIEKLYDLDNSEIKFSKLEVNEEKRKYSSSVTRILYVDGIPLTGKQLKYCKVDWSCRCGRINTMLLVKYLNKTNYWCQHCNQDPSYEKRLHANKKGRKRKAIQLSTNLRIAFNDMPNDFKEKYYNKHISNEILYKYLPYIYSLNDVLITADTINMLKYEFISPTNNQMKFCPKISFDNGNTWKSIHKIELKCPICGKIFNIHKENLCNQDINNIKCRSCKLSNYTYPILLYKNTSLTYQSNLELQFIEFCLDNAIKIENGFEIQYLFNNKYHIYVVDFVLPDLRILIELKGSNHFYKNDLKSGKIEAKNNAAQIFCEQNNYIFQFVLDKNIDNLYNFILEKRDSLNNSESELKIR